MSLALRQISLTDLDSLPLPSLKIQSEEDVITWTTTTGYRDYLLFLGLLNEVVVGVELSWAPPAEIESVRKAMDLLDTLESWIADIPPQPTPQRFGNLAFREWGKRLEEEAPTLLRTLLPAALHPAIPHLAPYLLTAFGSFSRMDYGTGHETAWAIFMCGLALVRFFPFPAASDTKAPAPGTHPAATQDPTNSADLTGPPNLAIERALALVLFPRYIALTWALQDVYRLEPAGSHGVWGLDDSSFLGYYWGSAQMRDSPTPPSALLPSATAPLEPRTLYHTHLARITQVKTGPFHEHSAQLHTIAVGVRGWGKVNAGLGKMYLAEVLGKRVVVQHIPLGGLIAWDPSSPASSASSTSSTSSASSAIPRPMGQTTLPPVSRTQVPWQIPSLPTLPVRAPPRSGAGGTRWPSAVGSPPQSGASGSGGGASGTRAPWATAAGGGHGHVSSSRSSQTDAGSARAPWAAAVAVDGGPVGTSDSGKTDSATSVRPQDGGDRARPTSGDNGNGSVLGQPAVGVGRTRAPWVGDGGHAQAQRTSPRLDRDGSIPSQAGLARAPWAADGGREEE